MDIAFQILMPGYDYDLGARRQGTVATAGSSSPRTTREQANTKLEVNASQNDKDFIAAVNWKQAEECVARRQGEADAGRVLPQL